jgi:hypothetical protein
VFKLSTLILFIFLLFQEVSAQVETFHMNGRLSGFYSTSGQFRKIYGNGLANYEIEIGKIFSNNYEIWGNAGWLAKKGHTATFHSKTKFENVNLSFGSKYVLSLQQCMQLYVGLGMNTAIVHVHNDQVVDRNKKTTLSN